MWLGLAAVAVTARAAVALVAQDKVQDSKSCSSARVQVQCCCSL